MRVVVVGLGVQGEKRLKIAGAEAVTTVDPISPEAVHQRIETVPLADYDAALVCTPDGAKPELLRYLLSHGKHLLVEKPLIADDDQLFAELEQLSQSQGATCYTAYNHRFEPHLVRLKELLDAGKLGQVYQCKFFYGNGTARDVRNSAWRDQGLGVFPDLGSHLLDWTLMLFGAPTSPPQVWQASRFENRAYDHFQFGFRGSLILDYEMTMLSWRNTFRLDLFAEKGSVHIDGLCKWGPSVFTHRERVLPSGRPPEVAQTLVCPDPTWQLEYDYFKQLCQKPQTNLANDRWINSIFQQVAALTSLPQ